MNSHKEPAYLQLYRRLRTAITTGAYPAGSRLPGKRTISEREGLSLITVEHALAILEEEGYIETRPRSGTFVVYQADVFFSEPEETKLIPQVGPQPDEESFPYSVYMRAVRKVLSEQNNVLLRKAEGQGLLSFRQELARYLARSRGMRVAPEQIVIGCGAEYLYGLIVQMLGRDRLAAVEDPCYEKIVRIYEAEGLQVERLKMGRSGIRADALRNARATLLHITPYNSYPSGVTASASKRRAYILWARERNGYLVEDDYESEFTLSSKAEDTLFSLEPDHTVFYVNTFNRTIGPALRVGYMILPRRFVPVFQKKAGFYACTVSTLSQLVLQELLADGSFERHVNRVRRLRRKKKSQ